MVERSDTTGSNVPERFAPRQGCKRRGSGAVWEDIKFDVRHFADIERLAMVGDKQWQHSVAGFFKPFTKATSRYFDHADAAEARKWWGEA